MTSASFMLWHYMSSMSGLIGPVTSGCGACPGSAAGIVASAKVGRVRTFQLVPGALEPAADWISRQRRPAERRLDRLGALLNRPATTTKE